MPGTVPTTPRALYAFANVIAPRWVENYAAIGLTESQAAEIAAQTPQLRAAIFEADQARNAALAATQRMELAARSLFDLASVAVRTIRTHAIANDDPNVYTKGGLETPKVRSRRAQPPAPPTNLSATIQPTGAIALTWKTSQPRGVSNVTFEVHRCFNRVDAAEQIVGIASGREFIDDTVPRGMHSVHYRLVPRRGSQEGASSDIFTLNLGSLAPIATHTTPLQGTPATTSPPPARRAA